MNSLRSQILVPALAVGIVMGAGLGIVSLDALAQVRELRGVARSSRESGALTVRLNQLTLESQRAVLSYRFRADPAFLARVRVVEREASDVLARIDASQMPSEGRRLWQDYVGNRDDQVRRRQLLLAAIGEGDGELIALAFEQWRLGSELSSALLADFTGYNQRRLENAVADVQSRRTRVLAMVGVFILTTGAAVAALTVYLTRSVARPIVQIAGTAERIAREQRALPVGGTGRDDEIGVLARAFEDMTHRLVKANADLRAAVQARDDFLSVASHELKTPLTSLHLQVQLASKKLQGGDVGPGEWARSVEVFDAQVRRLETLVALLLDETRLRAGRFELTRAQTDLGDLAQRTVERFSREIARGGHELKVDAPAGIVGSWDRQRLELVISNLITNALKYAPGAPLRVAVERDGESAAVVVADGGPGLPADLEGRTFSRFERGTNAQGQGGLGLGLYIVRHIVEAHGGKVSVQTVPGSGTTFRVELPLQAGSAASAPPP
jgi:signal transduction histidine kinase